MTKTYWCPECQVFPDAVSEWRSRPVLWDLEWNAALGEYESSSSCEGEYDTVSMECSECETELEFCADGVPPKEA